MTTKEQKEQAGRRHSHREPPPFNPDRNYHPQLIANAEESFIAGAEWVESQMRWIPVVDAVPEVDQRILFWEGYKVVLGGYHYSGAGELQFWTDDDVICFPTHWMPIPEPPAKEDGKYEY